MYTLTTFICLFLIYRARGSTLVTNYEKVQLPGPFIAWSRETQPKGLDISTFCAALCSALSEACLLYYMDENDCHMTNEIFPGSLLTDLTFEQGDFWLKKVKNLDHITTDAQDPKLYIFTNTHTKEYSVAEDSFALVSDTHPVPGSHLDWCSIVFSDNLFLAVNCLDTNANALTGHGYLWAPHLTEWFQFGSEFSADQLSQFGSQFGASAVILTNSVWIIGGVSAISALSSTGSEVSMIKSLSLKTNEWKAGPSLQTATRNVAVVAFSETEALLVGGVSDGSVVADAYILNGEDGSLRAVAGVPDSDAHAVQCTSLKETATGDVLAACVFYKSNDAISRQYFRFFRFDTEAWEGDYRFTDRENSIFYGHPGHETYYVTGGVGSLTHNHTPCDYGPGLQKNCANNANLVSANTLYYDPAENMAVFFVSETVVT